MKKHYSIKATLITIFSMLGSICAADNGVTQNFYKLYWVKGKKAKYSETDTINYIIVHEDCTPNDIQHVLMNEKFYDWWEGSKHYNNNSNSKGVYITLFSEKGTRINSNYNWKKNDRKSYLFCRKDYKDNNNDISVNSLLKEANSKQKPIINTKLSSKSYTYVTIGNEIIRTDQAISNTNYRKIKETGIEKREVKKNNKITKHNKGNLTNNIVAPIAAITSLNNKPLLNSEYPNDTTNEQGELNNNNNVTNNSSKENDNADIDSNNKPNNNKDDITKINSNDDISNNEQSKKEISSDIEEEDDELLNNDDEGKNKKLTVGKVIAFLTVIALFGIGGFYIYKNGHKLTKLDVKKKKKKQQ